MATSQSVTPPVLVCLTEGGERLANRIAGDLGAVVHGRTGRTQADVQFDDTLAHVRDLFAAGTPIIGICAAGILIRAVAPLLGDKHSEPAVLALSEDGASVVPLLGGHHGANALARRIGSLLDAHPAVTTASDVVLHLALDEPPAGWRITNPGALGAVTAALIAGHDMHVAGICPHLDALRDLSNVTFDPEAGGGNAARGATLYAVDPDGPPASDRWIGYQPMDVALGVGCARDFPPEELSALVHSTLASADLPPEAVAAVFSLDLKADEAAMLDLAQSLGVPLSTRVRRPSCLRAG